MDDDEKKKHTLDTLFLVWCNHKVLQTGNELETLVFNSILLSQLDAWLMQAKLMPAPITRTQTGLIYMRYKKWRLEYEDFLEVLQQLCLDSNRNYDEFKEIMLQTGIPSGATDTVVVAK